MKKINYKLNKFYDNRNKRIKHRKIRKAISKKHRKHNISLSRQETIYIHELRRERKKVLKNLHQNYNYSSGKRICKIKGEIGIEEDRLIDGFLKTASEIIDFDNNELTLDLKKCDRVWPSAVTLLCSLKEWVEFASKNNKLPHPIISSTDSNSIKVNSYLTHCGFHDYVGRQNKPNEEYYDIKHVVKINREFNVSDIPKREDEIVKLLERVTEYSGYEIELFNSIILTESFLNVQEHGVTCHDQGWWLLAQYHPKHKIVSFNIADNGIGFKNNLLTGPQKSEILDKISEDSTNDDYYIRMAMEENISGAYNASQKEKILFKKGYIRGARRGNGLERIRETCKQLNIAFSVLSHYGYIFYNNEGKLIKNGTKNNRIFGGTLYNFIIPAKEIKNGNY